MRIDKRSYSQIEKALSGIDLPISVYTASGEQVYPATPVEVREEEIAALQCFLPCWQGAWAARQSRGVNRRRHRLIQERIH